MIGEVVEIGANVNRFKIGDRVVGHAAAVDKNHNDPAKGGFQLYVVLLEHMTCAIPNRLSYEQASVIPLGVSTAACGLFQQDQLALSPPSSSIERGSKRGSVIIWGGSTSVGSNAIQLAVSAGYDVVTTCSPKNFDYVKRLGATEAFDYNSTTVKTDIVRALKGKNVLGALTIGDGAAEACMDILPQCEGKKKFMSMATYPNPSPAPQRFVIPRTILHFVSWQTSMSAKSVLRGIKMKFIFGTTLIENGVGKAIYADFLPEALAKGTFIPSPEPLVVGQGLESIQAACDIQKKGVSARKIVVRL